MILKSIKLRLQLWYGLILVAVLVGFGVTAFQLERSRVLRRIDGDLTGRANLMGNVVRQTLRGGAIGNRPLRRPLATPEPEPDMDHSPELPPGRPDIRLPFGLEPEGLDPRPMPDRLRLTPQAAALFDESDSAGFYFVFWWRDGTEIARSTNAPTVVPPPPKPLPPDPQTPRMRGEYREALRRTPPGEIILVGRSIVPELNELRHTAIRLVVVGGCILLLGLAGGWWLAGRAIRPVADISAAAQKISTGDLSQRIQTRDTETELGQLAHTLNNTFARLEKSFAQQAQFTSDAAHELRTPIAVMLAQTQSILSKERPSAEYRETLEACQRAAQRMRRLSESLLQLARLDAGQETIRRESFDLAAVARNCVELIRPLAAEKHVTLQLDLQATKCTGDPERVAQVVTNLVTNAIRHNAEGIEVRLATRPGPGLAVLTVQDSGGGISAADLPHVFERFYRADKARASSEGNAGLGLSICRAIAEAHGGTIEVASEPGRGTAFTVRLPA